MFQLLPAVHGNVTTSPTTLDHTSHHTQCSASSTAACYTSLLDTASSANDDLWLTKIEIIKSTLTPFGVHTPINHHDEVLDMLQMFKYFHLVEFYFKQNTQNIRKMVNYINFNSKAAYINWTGKWKSTSK